MVFMDGYAIASYERLRLYQPHFKTMGLYKKGYSYFILCEDINVAPINSENDIVDVFHKEMRVMGCKIDLVTELPEGTIKVEERTDRQRVNLTGAPLNSSQFETKLIRMCGDKLPSFRINYLHEEQKWEVMAESEMTLEQQRILSINLKEMLGNEHGEIIYTINKEIFSQNKGPLKNSSMLINISKYHQNKVAKNIFEKWEFDEQLWETKKMDIILGEEKNNEFEKSSCLINGQFQESSNIRNYLTLFDEINLVMPVGEDTSKFFHDLDISEVELLKLIEMEKVKLIYPNSIERYDLKLLEKAIEINSQKVIFSRQLALSTIKDIKSRNPLLSVFNNYEDRLKMLEELVLVKNYLNLEEQRFLDIIINTLINYSSDATYDALEFRGALGTFNLGITPIINEIYKVLKNSDLLLEIMSAANSIEWAAAQNAVLCPVGPFQKNEIHLANLYSGFNTQKDYIFQGQPNTSIDGILTIAKYVPVTELAEAFTSEEITRFRNLILQLTSNRNSEQIDQIIKDFNREVKSFEKKNSNLETWDVQGTLTELAQEGANLTVPFSGFIIKQLNRYVNYKGSKNKKLGEFVDTVESKLKRTKPNVVLVSRMRNKIKDLL